MSRYYTAFLAVAVLGFALVWRTTAPPVHSQWLTLFLALFLQAAPLVLLGHGLAALPWRWVPRSVPAAAAAGMLLPTCECASVPVARGLIDKGAPPRAAVAFMLAAPSINPLVLLSTWLAFNDWRIVAARFVCGAAAALIIGSFWRRPLDGHHHTPDILDTLSFVVIGCAAAATLAGIPQPAWPGGIAVAAAMALAILMSVCSEADAFVAATLPTSALAQLAFMVIGPLVDIKLIAVHWGTWGPRAALRIVGASILTVALLMAIASIWI
ncbi:hypothetical protein C1Y63_04060 [Corynebacterium sp. 13CS0277]|uniref:permease n=1 Tax=Corynebacterium sp. 13CS0277 TaxID=2071994 RepID=UPI000D02F74C|nr:permease [Corynebacterium sp. 13CS0277]PRQ11825.1 hypothetical protein C1Y63_04060 [Corynebacterium sp. 13CS0277]